MDINAAQAVVIQAADAHIEDAFSNGVDVDAVQLLNPIEGYNTVPDQYRIAGRKGVESTFAALLRALAEASPEVADLIYSPGFGPWSDTAYRPFRVTKDALGVVRFSGTMTIPGSAAGVTAVSIPAEFRPQTNLIAWGITSTGSICQTTVSSLGRVILDSSTSAGWVSFQLQYTVA